jgi:hypothetical protein
MNKPEFPKARLIREDFLPEQDPMERYRIKKITTGDGTVWYAPQTKILWFWIYMSRTEEPYGSESWANAVIRSDFKDRQKDKVEYLQPDTSGIVPPNPNPPPEVL